MDRHSLKTIITSSLTIIVLIITIIASTYAWLYQNNKAENKGMVYKIDDSRGVAVHSCDVYKRDGLLGAQRVSDRDVSMTEFDTVFTDKNVNTPLIFRIALSFTDEMIADPPDIKLGVSCGEAWRGDSWEDGTWTVTKDSEGQVIAVGEPDGSLTEYMSNLASIRFAAGTEELDTIPLDSASEMYSSAVAYLEENAEGLGYAKVSTISNGRDVKYENLSKTRNVSALIKAEDYEIRTGSEDPDLKNKVVLYVEITYDNDLVAAYVDQNGIKISATSSEAGSDTIRFVNDIGEISFDFVYE